ncbi:hypothetical protein B0T18DRAFT_315992 [Schizothecium vesticola]|uniref:Rhodopsin domain-containing protein n=1 Tax=Schizothecium vesticola TaxID=314040 RepID=A0AA40FCD4_9PEZI|nr:hypothetical protein B0T18DRAFT_315992 [Schizothecium vesticola]
MNASTVYDATSAQYNITDGARRNFSSSLGNPALWRARQQTGDLGPTTRASIWILVCASLVFLLMRLYCKAMRHRKFHADDWFAIAAWMALLGSTISTNRTIDLGFGKHSYMIDPRNINEMYLIGKISVTLTVCSQAWSKTSFAITLLMISDGFHGRTRIFLWFAVVSMNLFFGTAAMLFWVGCSPVEKAWNLFVPGKCWSQYVPVLFMIFTSAYSGIMDLIFAIIPWKIIMRMQMETKEKIGVALAMSMGVFAAAAAFIKCSSVPELAGRNFSHDGVGLVIWGNAETAVTLMAASMPMFRSLLRSAATTRRQPHPGLGSERSRRNVGESSTGRSSRRVYYNKPRRDLVTMTGSTWTNDSRMSIQTAVSGLEKQ